MCDFFSIFNVMDNKIKMGDLVRMDSENTIYEEGYHNPRDCYGIVVDSRELFHGSFGVQWIKRSHSWGQSIDHNTRRENPYNNAYDNVDLIKIPKKEKSKVIYGDDGISIKSKFLLNECVLSSNDRKLNDKVREFFDHFKKLVHNKGKIEYVNCYYNTDFTVDGEDLKSLILPNILEKIEIET